MSLSQLFSLSSILVVPFWFMMIVLPLWSVTRRVIASPFISAGAAVLYLALVLPRLGEVLSAVSGGGLANVSTLLGSPAGATIAWAHFLAFDLFVGRWAYLESRERDIHPFVMAPVLFCVFMLGPDWITSLSRRTSRYRITPRLACRHALISGQLVYAQPNIIRSSECPSVLQNNYLEVFHGISCACASP